MSGFAPDTEMPRESVTKALRAENAKLREALEWIVGIAAKGGKSWEDTAKEMFDVAADALATAEGRERRE